MPPSLHEPLPGFYGPILARFALPWHERLVARWLVRLVGFPGVARLLFAWHARRARRALAGGAHGQ
jgi:hypothetical protein